MTSKTKGLVQRYAVPLLIVLAIGFGIVGAETIRSQKRLLLEEVERGLAASAVDLASRGEVPFLLGDPELLEAEIAHSLAEVPDAQFGVFRDPAGVPIASVGLDSLSTAVIADLDGSSDRVAELSGYLLAQSTLLDGTGTVRGHVLLGASTERVDGVIRRASWRLSAIAGAAFLVVALFAGALLRRIQGLTTNLERRVEQRTQELAEARDRAMDASRLKSEFLANMSHEIRTPMNGVVALSDLLVTTQLDGQQQRWASLIRRSARQLLTIIDDILDVSKIEAGMLAIEAEPIDFDQVIQDVVDVQSERATEKGVSLSLQWTAEESGLLLGDSVRIAQITTNLVSNAIKFTEEGEVAVSVTVQPSEASQRVYESRSETPESGSSPMRCRLSSSPSPKRMRRRLGGSAEPG